MIQQVFKSDSRCRIMPATTLAPNVETDANQFGKPNHLNRNHHLHIFKSNKTSRVSMWWKSVKKTLRKLLGLIEQHPFYLVSQFFVQTQKSFQNSPRPFPLWYIDKLVYQQKTMKLKTPTTKNSDDCYNIAFKEQKWWLPRVKCHK